jgi:hypothetical protein
MKTFNITLRYEATYNLEVEASDYEEAIKKTEESLETEIEAKGETLIETRVKHLTEKENWKK